MLSGWILTFSAEQIHAASSRRPIHLAVTISLASNLVAVAEKTWNAEPGQFLQVVLAVVNDCVRRE